MIASSLVQTLLEGAINTYLSLDPELQRGLAELAGKRVALSVRGTPIVVSLCLEQNGLRIIGTSEEPVDVTVEATPLAFMRLLRASGTDHPVFGKDITIVGEVVDVQRLQSLVRRHYVDREELLAKLIGDIGAHQIGNLWRGLVRTGRQMEDALLQDAGEYLSEEIHMTPARTELDALTLAVDTLRDDTERLAKRIGRLQRSRAERAR